MLKMDFVLIKKNASSPMAAMN